MVKSYKDKVSVGGLEEARVVEEPKFANKSKISLCAELAGAVEEELLEVMLFDVIVGIVTGANKSTRNALFVLELVAVVLIVEVEGEE